MIEKAVTVILDDQRQADWWRSFIFRRYEGVGGEHCDSGHFENWTKIFHCPTSSGASEWASEQTNERASGWASGPISWSLESLCRSKSKFVVFSLLCDLMIFAANHLPIAVFLLDLNLDGGQGLMSSHFDSHFRAPGWLSQPPFQFSNSLEK